MKKEKEYDYKFAGESVRIELRLGFRAVWKLEQKVKASDETHFGRSKAA